MFKNFPSSFAILAAFFAALGTFFFIMGAHTLYRNIQFAGNVVRVNGTVTNHFITHSHSRHGTSTTYHLSYHFADTEGRSFESSTSATGKTYYQLGTNSTVPVKYLPNLPTINRIDLPAEDRNYETTAEITLILGGIFGGLGWYVFIGLERQIFYRRWLRRSGIQRVGTVDQIETNYSLSINNRHPSYLHYSFTDSTGTLRQDTSPYLSLKQESLWKEGDTIDVFYDPCDPGKSTVRLDRPQN